MHSTKTNISTTVSKLMHLYGYHDRHTTRDLKELALALLGDPLTRQHGFELVLARPVPVAEIASNQSLKQIWDLDDKIDTYQELQVIHSVESLTH